MVAQVRCGLGHAPRAARGADAAAFAGEGEKEVVPAVIATHPCKAVGKDAAFQILAESLLYISGRGVVVALAVELAGTGQLKPSLEVFGNRAVQQGALGMAGVVGFGGFRSRRSSKFNALRAAGRLRRRSVTPGAGCSRRTRGEPAVSLLDSSLIRMRQPGDRGSGQQSSGRAAQAIHQG